MHTELKISMVQIVNKIFFIPTVCTKLKALFKRLQFFAWNVIICSPKLKGLISEGEGLNKGVLKLFLRSLLEIKREIFMSENRIAVINVIVERRENSAEINELFSCFGDYIIGRMGIPYREKGVSVICVVLDAPTEIINTLTGKIGMLKGVSAKTLMSKK